MYGLSLLCPSRYTEEAKRNEEAVRRSAKHNAVIQPELVKYLGERVAEALRAAFSRALAASHAAGASARYVRTRLRF
jgi:hypothetical protein